MKWKGEAHEALSLVFQCEGLLVMDGSKEQTLGKFHQNFRDAGCKRKITEPFSPWQNAAEREIKTQERHW